MMASSIRKVTNHVLRVETDTQDISRQTSARNQAVEDTECLSEYFTMNMIREHKDTRTRVKIGFMID